MHLEITMMVMMIHRHDGDDLATAHSPYNHHDGDVMMDMLGSAHSAPTIN